MILIGGLRYRLGTDTVMYERSYNVFPDFFQFISGDFKSTDPEFDRFGTGFIFLGSIPKTFANDFFLLQLFQAAFVNILIFKFFRDYSPAKFLSVLLYFIIVYFYFIFEIMREACAVAMFLFAWKYYINSKWKKYYLCAIIAVLFHTSALLVLILPILKLPGVRNIFRINLRFLIILFSFTLLLSYLYMRFFEFFELINLFDISEYAEKYSDNYLAEETDRSMAEIIIYVILYCMLPILLVIYLKKFANHKPSYLPDLEAMICMYLLITIATLFVSLLFRFNNYFNLFYILLISDVIFSSFRLRKSRYRLDYAIWMFILIPIILPYVRGYFVGEGVRKIDMYYPYESVFTQVKNPKREQIYNAREADADFTQIEEIEIEIIE